MDSIGCDFAEDQASTVVSIVDCALNERASAALHESQGEIVADRKRALQEWRRNNNATQKIHTAQQKESSPRTASV